MKQSENQGGGITFILSEGDSLDAVPASHADILTPELRDAFRDPRECFAEIARRTIIESFRKLLTKSIAGGKWRMVLADTYMMERETVGAFYWAVPDVMPVMLEPGATTFDDDDGDPDFRHLYSLVRHIQWGEVAYSGGLFSPRYDTCLKNYGCRSESDLFPVETSSVFGNMSDGDILVHNSEGLAATLSHETGRPVILGSIPDALEWVFNELLANREPEHNYTAEQKDGPRLGLWSPPDDEA